MNGRRSIRKLSHIPTVSMIRRQQKKRLEKQKEREGTSKDSIDHLSLLLKILASSSITVERSKVVDCLSHYAQNLRIYPYTKSPKYQTATRHTSKALNLIFDDLFRLVELERDDYVLKKLLELVPELKGPFTWDILESRAASEISDCRGQGICQKWYLEKYTTLILHWSSDEDRQYLRGRYEDELRMSLMKMNFRAIEELMNKHEIMDLIESKTGSTLLDTIINTDGYFAVTPRVCGILGRRVALQLFRYLLDSNTSEKQIFLGLFCSVARYFAAFPFDGDEREAQTFREILAAYPEWNESFRIATSCDNPISHTALLGQSIQPRRSNPALYIIIDEEVEMI
ncbi:hypothetical protein PRIPAC_91175 [Pristionchus pacificus]|uniref:Uncharacterized protein n=1 Tax=Pristionchus pacificus TaxID=54126 RepID=A0A2A6BYP8_PRIPA|nr:hypothetical protein PRIPAC_91175 [Pristionchus pacificus]|eukprot:PDM71122.1 hypothetical protein PRIPAC_43505 [Pristionchus pacificus]